MSGISEIHASGPKSTGVKAPKRSRAESPAATSAPPAPAGALRAVVMISWAVLARGIRPGAGFEGDITARAISDLHPWIQKTLPRKHVDQRSRRIRPIALREQRHPIGLNCGAQIGRTHP